VCGSYCAKLQQSLEGLAVRAYKNEESSEVKIALLDFARLTGLAFGEAMKEATSTYLAHIWPAFRQSLQIFGQTSYELDQNLLKEFEINDPWVRALLAQFHEFYSVLKVRTLVE